MPDDAPTTRRPWRWTDDATLAVVFLTRIPLRLPPALPPDAHGRAMAWFPVVGALVGLAGGAVFALAQALGQPPMVAALLAVAATAWVTGALHEDGLADVADGFGGGWNRERKLEIMKDSRVGTYGALAVVLSVGLRAAALAELGQPDTILAALVTAGAASRGVMPVIVRAVPSARPDGVAASHGLPPRGRALVALVVGIGIAIATLGADAAVALPVAALGAAAVTRLAVRQIEGYTGDVLGAVQQTSETLILLSLVALR
ncbi:adenosylcobinamide-GDP ribazoletransferase [Azospirillum sp. RWY-5-1]|uniref:Adenosylcobinamide-GDP ribazoletransferase n=1 Tax=Azospirillum oleiclasticum TaxID=2735135 RepID=A0ABX2TH74_9PROT|nr:adenosylcobinamide-GDP ribazoletransferase [Azospirillum oleiclasticum]NYZ15913.1 adenosylcobinamide-GDP ribazoletransferase [Azospirillum oleiclasticum]NYZ23608.1 adenosylcobinamide-GDP ribazoletransferase [Azospirillum oleiclasticum]